MIVGEQFGDPILVAQVLVPKGPTQWIFVEYELKNSVSVSFNGLMHGLREYTNKNENATVEKSPKMIRLKTWLIDQCSKASLQSSLLFFFSSSPLLGDLYILYRPFPIIWALHLLIIQIPTWAPVPSDTPLNSLWVVVAKVALFMGLLLINVARGVVVMHLMWWWQPLLRYFGFPSFLRIRKIDYSG